MAGEVLKVYENWDQSKMEESAAFRRKSDPGLSGRNARTNSTIMNELGLQSDQRPKSDPDPMNVLHILPEMDEGG